MFRGLQCNCAGIWTGNHHTAQYVYLNVASAGVLIFQTGSGKTYTMGTGFDITIPPSELGMIPRAVGQIFSSIEQCKRNALDKNDPIPHFEVKTQFLEVFF